MISSQRDVCQRWSYIVGLSTTGHRYGAVWCGPCCCASLQRLPTISWPLVTSEWHAYSKYRRDCSKLLVSTAAGPTRSEQRSGMKRGKGAPRSCNKIVPNTQQLICGVLHTMSPGRQLEHFVYQRWKDLGRSLRINCYGMKS